MLFAAILGTIADRLKGIAMSSASFVNVALKSEIFIAKIFKNNANQTPENANLIIKDKSNEYYDTSREVFSKKSFPSNQW